MLKKQVLTLCLVFTLTLVSHARADIIGDMKAAAKILEVGMSMNNIQGVFLGKDFASDRFPMTLFVGNLAPGQDMKAVALEVWSLSAEVLKVIEDPALVPLLKIVVVKGDKPQGLVELSKTKVTEAGPLWIAWSMVAK
ncbi:MAG: hypothetical protein FWG97_01300 [Deltaproteobacteria bacterium]|nr:hypothetical protein [Deltaproteobacteria bacterium]